MILRIDKVRSSVFETGRLMRRIATAFSGDVRAHVDESPHRFFERVRDIPYQADPDGMEFLQRPAITLANGGPGGDCDDKSIVLGAFFHENRIPYHFIAASRSATGPLHHVWVLAKIDRKWENFDCTYAWNSVNQLIGSWPLAKIIG